MEIEFEQTIEIEDHEIKAVVVAVADMNEDTIGNLSCKHLMSTVSFIEAINLNIYDASGNNITQKLRDKYPLEFLHIELKAEEKILETHYDD